MLKEAGERGQPSRREKPSQHHQAANTSSSHSDRNRMFHWWLPPGASLHQSQLGTSSFGLQLAPERSLFHLLARLFFCYQNPGWHSGNENRFGFHHSSGLVYHTLAIRPGGPTSSTAPVGYCLFIRLDDWHAFRLSHRSSPAHLASCLSSQLCDSWQSSIFGSLQPPTRSPAFHWVFLPLVL